MVLQQKSSVRNNSSSLRRALRVLDGVARYRGPSAGISLSSLAVSLDMSKSTVLRLIGPLREEGLVHQDRNSGRYRLGPAAARLGAAFAARIDLDLLAADLIGDLSERSGQHVCLVTPDRLGVGQTGGNGGSSAGAAVLRSCIGFGGASIHSVDGRVRDALLDRGWWAELDNGSVPTLAAPVHDALAHVVGAIETKLPPGAGRRPGALSDFGVLVGACAARVSARLGAPLPAPGPGGYRFAHLADGTAI